MPGKTSFLYSEKCPEQWNNGEIVVVPTLGFNVETIRLPESSRDTLTMVDIGGCDKIRPLIRYYYDGIEAGFFFVAADLEENFRESLELCCQFLSVYEFPQVPCVVFVTHQDMPADQRLPIDYVREQIQDKLVPVMGRRPFLVVEGSATDKRRQGHAEALRWLSTQLRIASAVGAASAPATSLSASSTSSTSSSASPSSSSSSSFAVATTGPGPGAGVDSQLLSAQQKATKMQFALDDDQQQVEAQQPSHTSITISTQISPPSETDGLTDEQFVEAVRQYNLPVWDHKTHLRLAYLVLTQGGRRPAVSLIMQLISDFIEHSPRVGGRKTFHMTMTYFWIQMVHVGIVRANRKFAATSAPGCTPSFEQVLTAFPRLMDGGLFRDYYSDDLMLRSEAPRKVFVLPDKQPLPNVLSL